MRSRDTLSLSIELLIWLAAMAWILFLGYELMAAWRRHGVFLWRSAFELVLLGVLVYWPLIRSKLRYGYSMRDWDDVPPHLR